MNDQPMPAEGEITNFRDKTYHFRSEPRYKCPLAFLSYVDVGGTASETIWLANVSQNGVAFVATQPVEVGSALQMVIPPLGRDSTLAITVVHSTRQCNGDWLIGCRFDQPLTDSQLDICLQVDGEFSTNERFAS